MVLGIICFAIAFAICLYVSTRPMRARQKVWMTSEQKKSIADLEKGMQKKMQTLPQAMQDEVAKKIVEKEGAEKGKKIVEKAVTNIENKTGRVIYKDDFDPQEIQDYLKQAAGQIGLTDDEVANLTESMESALGELPARPPAVDDTCPECGETFAMVDDYLCAKCRARMT